MCLIVFAWHVIPGMPLMAAANRDEFFDRPALPAAWWDDHPQVHAGRDLRGGGTWLGISRNGRFAALTNVRAPGERRADAPSRGALVADYLGRPAERTAVLFYSGWFLLAALSFNLVWRAAARDGRLLDPNADPVAVQGITQRFRLGLAGNAFAFVVAFVSPEASLVALFLLDLTFVLPYGRRRKA